MKNAADLEKGIGRRPLSGVASGGSTATSRRWLGLIVAALALCAISGAMASADDQAKASAVDFLKAVDFGDLKQVYAGTSPLMKTNIAESAFVNNMSMFRIQTGGPASSRSIVGEQPFDQLPTGVKGEFYFIRYRSVYPNGPIFQDVYLEKLAGGAWKVGGIWMNAVPK
jgi:uncharacterized protein DUF4019